jgi:serine/threonine protein kinase
MNDFNEIKDIEGNAHFAIKKNNYKEKENIGKNLDDFEFLQILGEGGFGEVYKVKSKLNNKIYAMKKVDLKKFEKDELKKYAERETKLLSLISHPRVIKYYDNFPSKNKEYLYIIMENAENGDLDSLLNAYIIKNEYIPEEDLWTIFLQCMQGLVYIHKYDVIHRDIKPENIFIDNNMNIKIGDFGFAAVKKDETDENKKYTNVGYGEGLNQLDLKYGGTKVGTKGYMADEIQNRKYDQKVDVYSMGVTFYELCFQHLPSRHIKTHSENYSDEMIKIVIEMIEEDAETRQTSEYFLKKIEQEFSKKYNRITSINALMSCLHSFEDISVPIKDQPIKQLKNVVIGEGCWIGEHVSIIGASIGKHSVVGANSVVTHDIPDYCVAVGSPAYIIKRYNFESRKWEKTDRKGNFIV